MLVNFHGIKKFKYIYIYVYIYMYIHIFVQLDRSYNFANLKIMFDGGLKSHPNAADTGVRSSSVLIQLLGLCYLVWWKGFTHLVYGIFPYFAAWLASVPGAQYILIWSVRNQIYTVQHKQSPTWTSVIFKWRHLNIAVGAVVWSYFLGHLDLRADFSKILLPWEGKEIKLWNIQHFN
jgi:hypothetical protein